VRTSQARNGVLLGSTPSSVIPSILEHMLAKKLALTDQVDHTSDWTESPDVVSFIKASLHDSKSIEAAKMQFA